MHSSVPDPDLCLPVIFSSKFGFKFRIFETINSPDPIWTFTGSRGEYRGRELDPDPYLPNIFLRISDNTWFNHIIQFSIKIKNYFRKTLCELNVKLEIFSFSDDHVKFFVVEKIKFYFQRKLVTASPPTKLTNNK